MSEKRWTIVQPTLKQLAPSMIAAGAYSYFAILSNLQFCVNDAYNFFEILFALISGALLISQIIKLLYSTVSMRITGIHQICILVVFVLVGEYNPRLDMLAQNYSNNKESYQAMSDGIIKSGLLKTSDKFEYYDYLVPDGEKFCFRGIRAMRRDNNIFILFPVDIHNDVSRRSYFEGFLYSLTGEYPTEIFPEKQTHLLRQLDTHWYIIYESPPDRTRRY